jgi:hypothetical protein
LLAGWKRRGRGGRGAAALTLGDAVVGRFEQKETLLGVSAKKEEDFPTWYSDVITRSDMIDYYDISG